MEPFQHVVKSGVEVWDSSSQSVRGNAEPIPKKKSTRRPNFIEEIMEDTDTSSEIVEIGVCMQGWEKNHHTDMNHFSVCLNVTIFDMFVLGLLSDFYF